MILGRSMPDGSQRFLCFVFVFVDVDVDNYLHFSVDLSILVLSMEVSVFDCSLFSVVSCSWFVEAGTLKRV